jgi:hypothetical protein
MRENAGAINRSQAAGRRPACNLDVIAAQRFANLAERLGCVGQADLQVLMLAGLLTSEQIQCPASRDIPRRGYVLEERRHPRGLPGLAGRIIDRHATWRKLLVTWRHLMYPIHEPEAEPQLRAPYVHQQTAMQGQWRILSIQPRPFRP